MADNLTEVHLFEQRKRDHIALSMDPSNQTSHLSDFDRIHLMHNPLPECDLKEVKINTTALGLDLDTPLFISSMTAGHKNAVKLNLTLASVAAKHNCLMGVGSQRRELFDNAAHHEWTTIRRQVPGVKLMANIGLSQLINTSLDDIKRLCDNIEAVALIAHCNPLQEAIQPEGTPNFQGGLKALEKLCRELDRPIILKETGSGFSIQTLERCNTLGLAAIDLAGTGGTHWGRIEGQRAHTHKLHQSAAETFRDWGISTVDTLIQAKSKSFSFDLWGSGGVRNGLHAAKLLALGASMVGLAQPMLAAALEGEEALDLRINCLENELKIALFCTGHTSINRFRESHFVIK